MSRKGRRGDREARALAARLLLSGAVAVAAAMAPACGNPDSRDCPNDLPESCPSPEPSYMADVKPVMDEYCVPCHSPGGQRSDLPFTSYDEVYPNRRIILTRFYACSMPPAGSPAPMDEDRAALLGWLVCGAPDN